MARATIDLSAVVSQIEATVTASFLASQTKALTLAETSHNLASIREQIYSNTAVLWPMAQMAASHLRSHKEYALPDFQIIVYGTDKSFIAEVVYGEEAVAEKYVFIKGLVTESPEKALGKLLEATMCMLGNFHQGNVVADKNDKWVGTKGGGYFAPKG